MADGNFGEVRDGFGECGEIGDSEVMATIDRETEALCLFGSRAKPDEFQL